ncbi:helix-hairpin-helix domain-containing protein [Kribbella sp. NPDC023855]|uniref:ComEA family DNA-binding protein n=1 Tax=Kribbella sp. NPDC023855 TaxID=3154698 RepID=UPI0033C30F10
MVTPVVHSLTTRCGGRRKGSYFPWCEAFPPTAPPDPETRRKFLSRLHSASHRQRSEGGDPEEVGGDWTRDELPGGGPVLAQRIVDWRNEHDRFTSTDELQEVPGVDPEEFASLRPHVQA